MARDLNPNVYLTLILIVMLMDIIFLLLFTPLMLTFSPKRQISCCYRCRIIEFSIAFSFKMFLTGVCSCMMSHLSLSEYMIFFGGNLLIHLQFLFYLRHIQHRLCYFLLSLQLLFFFLSLFFFLDF